MSDDPKPTIRIASCRSDGRCPECARDWTERGVLSRLPLPPCGCHCCPDCGLGHTRGLLTEALRQRDEHYFKGIKDVRMIRCMAHHKVPAFNAMEANGGECAVCAVDSIGKERDAAVEAQKRHLNEATEAVHDLGAKLDAAIRECALAKQAQADERASLNAALRDVEMWKAKAIRVSGEADALERERDEAQAKLVEEREAMASISGELVQAQVKVAKERDSYRAALEECGELRSEARERAERAEALLRECLYPLTDRGYPTEALVTKIKGCLS